MDKLKITVILIVLLAILVPVSGSDIQRCGVCHSNIAENYTKSLHYTILGIRIAWDEGIGAMSHQPMPPICLKCHVENCSTCHIYHGYIPNMSICVDCHEHNVGVNYIGYLIEKMKKGPSPDIHYVYGLNCTTCHKEPEIHGDGNMYTYTYYAVKVRCLDCHGTGKLVRVGNKTIRAKKYDPTLTPHRIHAKVLSCVACHGAWYQTCINCHLDTGKIDKITTKEFHLIQGPDGKLYPAVRMIVTFQGKTYTTVGMIIPHTISPKGRPCSDCHNPNTINDVFLVGYKGRLVGPPGVKTIKPGENITQIQCTAEECYARPPNRIVVTVPVIGLQIDITMLGTLIIGATIAGIFLHYLKRIITRKGE